MNPLRDEQGRRFAMAALPARSGVVVAQPSTQANAHSGAVVVQTRTATSAAAAPAFDAQKEYERGYKAAVADAAMAQRAAAPRVQAAASSALPAASSARAEHERQRNEAMAQAAAIARRTADHAIPGNAHASDHLPKL